MYLVNEIDNRRFFNPDVENQFIIHSRLHFKRGKWDIGAGLTASAVYTQKPEDGIDHSTFELRPVAEATYEQLLGKILFQGRMRIDNRIFEQQADGSIWDDSYYVFRIRFRPQFRIPIKTSADGIPLIGLRLGEEIMFNGSKNTFDQHRLYASFDFYLNKNFSLETGYLYIYQQRLGQEEFYSRNVVRFSLLHRIARKLKT